MLLSFAKSRSVAKTIPGLFALLDEVITKRDPLDEKIQKLMPVS
jgi:hypothetical protein